MVTQDGHSDMEEEQANKLADGDQARASSLYNSQNTNEEYGEGAKMESQMHRIDTASLAKSRVEQGDEKLEESERRQDSPSERVQEGQRWNNRYRKQYGNQEDRPCKKHNNKADLVSQQESSDPFAIRKQVCPPLVLYVSLYSKNHIQGRILLFRFQSSDRQISIHQSRRP